MLTKLFYRAVMGFEIGSESYIFMGAWYDARGGFSIGNNSVVDVLPALSLRLPLLRAGRTGLPHRTALALSPIEGSKAKRRFIPPLKRGVLA